MRSLDKPVFPAWKEPNGLTKDPIGGLTRREFFAAMALQGTLANSTTMQALSAVYKTSGELAEGIAIGCVTTADALIEKLGST